MSVVFNGKGEGTVDLYIAALLPLLSASLSSQTGPLLSLGRDSPSPRSRTFFSHTVAQ